MAPVNGAVRSVNAGPPPSSMLAAHVVNGNGPPQLSRDSFAQLLEESLGTDDYGEPNLSRDENVNSKLVVVIVQLGIEPHLRSSNSDPFRSKPDLGKNGAELKCCLDVLQLAIDRSPSVLYKPLEGMQDDTNANAQLFTWLLPKLLSLLSKLDQVDLRRSVSNIISATIKVDAICLSGSCESILGFLSVCNTG